MVLPDLLEEWLAKGEQLITQDARPSWLLNSFDEDVWLLKTPGHFMSRKGTWQGTSKVHWKLRVPAGNLLDDTYQRLLRHCKLLAIARGESPTSRSSDIRAITIFHYYTLALAEFLIIHFRDEATLHGFRCLTYSKLETFLADYARDGVAGGGHWISRWDQVIQRAYESRSEQKCVMRWCADLSSAEIARIDNAHRPVASLAANEPAPVRSSLPGEVLHFARRWLACKGAFTTEGLLRLSFVADAIEIDAPRLRAAGVRVRFHLRQFELTEDYRPFEHRTAPHREFLSRRFISTDERALRTPVGQRIVYAQTCELVRLSNYIHDLQDSDLPSVAIESRLPAELRGTEDGGRTPTIPAAIALKLLDRMIGWSLHRTKPVFEYCASLTKEVVRQQGHARASERMARVTTGHQTTSVWERAFQRVPIPQPLADLQLYQFGSARTLRARQVRRIDGGSPIPAQLRSSMTVADVIELNTAILMALVSMLCARRLSEVLRLPHGCLVSRGGRFYLQFEISKVHIDGVRARAARPLPAFLALALRAQQEFSRFLVATYKPADPRVANALFVVPSHVGCRRVNSAFVYNNLDLLCDYFETALDEQGRRWYLRPHECRRFFAFTFFHAHGQEASLPALSWMLGHSNLQRTWRYIKEQLTGSEVSHSEATFAHAAIAGQAANQAAKQLRKTVLEHFGAPRLELVDPKDVQGLLELLHAEGRYRAEPCSIRTADGYRHTILIHLLSR